MAVDEVDSRNLLEQKRNLGLAYAMVLNKSAPNSEFARVLQSHAFDNLEAVYNAGMRDGEPTAVLAEMYWMSKDFARAGLLSRKALETPGLSAGWRGYTLLLLAECESQSGDWPPATGHLEQAVSIQRSAESLRNACGIVS